MATESSLRVDLKFNDGAVLYIDIPLGRSTEDRETIEAVFAILLRSWMRAYHPHPCPLCKWTGDANHLPTLEELRQRSIEVPNVEDAVS